jgi:putative pyruvate formate lyase activating enzyme
MWQLLRPDAVKALEDPLVKKILPRYIKVAEDELLANFQIAKKTPVKEMSWLEHEKRMKDFRKIRENIDSGKLKIEKLKEPKQSLLDLKIFLVKKIMKKCSLCEHRCGVNRLKGELGFCKVGNNCIISSEFVHTGEESYYVPSHTIFFWSCNMNCVFCQNFTISNRLEAGISVTPEAIARTIEKRRVEGCRNCNLVGGEPTMHLLWILEALNHCNVSTPIVWNSNMFMSEKTMEILNGIVDVYLTDFKFGPGECSEKLTKVKNYWNIAVRNHLTAASHAEVTIRHLVLPSHVYCCSFPVLRWVAKNIKEKCLVNPMDQYYPCFLAKDYPEINRRISHGEYAVVLEETRRLGLNVKG